MNADFITYSMLFALQYGMSCSVDVPALRKAVQDPKPVIIGLFSQLGIIMPALHMQSLGCWTCLLKPLLV